MLKEIIKFIESNNIKIELEDKLNTCYDIDLKIIYLNKKHLDSLVKKNYYKKLGCPNKYKYSFALLHEYAHAKQFNKYGEKSFIIRWWKDDKFQKVANRFARRYYKKFMKRR